MELAAEVKALARACGAQAVRVTSAKCEATALAWMHAALERGDLATWSYDAAYADAATDPARLLPGARSETDRAVLVEMALALEPAAPREALHLQALS